MLNVQKHAAISRRAGEMHLIADAVMRKGLFEIDLARRAAGHLDGVALGREGCVGKRKLGLGRRIAAVVRDVKVALIVAPEQFDPTGAVGLGQIHNRRLRSQKRRPNQRECEENSGPFGHAAKLVRIPFFCLQYAGFRITRELNFQTKLFYNSIYFNELQK